MPPETAVQSPNIMEITKIKPSTSSFGTSKILTKSKSSHNNIKSFSKITVDAKDKYYKHKLGALMGLEKATEILEKSENYSEFTRQDILHDFKLELVRKQYNLFKNVLAYMI